MGESNDVAVDDAVLEAAVHEGESMSASDLLDRIERYHDDESPGVSRDAIAAYARELASRRDFVFDADAFLEDSIASTTDSDSWEGFDHLYRLDGDRVSKYPARWHDRLGGSDAAAEFVALLEEVPGFVEDDPHSGSGSGISEDVLLDVMMVVGRVDREGAKTALEEARNRGAVTEDNDQHPQADVYLREDADEYRDESLE
jgi:hypothetical protein